MNFLIYRCSASDTLVQAAALRDHLMVSDDVLVPTCRVVRRVGRSRERAEQDVPLLGSFIFVRWDGEVQAAQYLERNFPHIKIMRLPQGGYATCTEKEVHAIHDSLFDMPEVLPVAELVQYKFGEEVEVQGGFLIGVIGKVIRTKQNGEVVLKITESKKWQLNTLLVHGSLLAYRQGLPDKAA